MSEQDPLVEFGTGWAKIHFRRDLTDDDRQRITAAARAPQPGDLAQGVRVRNDSIEEIAQYLDKLGARYHSGRDIIQRIRQLKDAAQPPAAPVEPTAPKPGNRDCKHPRICQHHGVCSFGCEPARSAAQVETDADAGAKLLGEWIGYAWDGIRDGRISDRGDFPQWCYNGIGHRQFQGGKDDLRDLAREIVALCRFSAVTGDKMADQSHWFYAGPYVPSGVVYDPERDISDPPSPSYSVWLVPGYERAYEAFAVIDLYNPPAWYKP